MFIPSLLCLSFRITVARISQQGISATKCMNINLIPEKAIHKHFNFSVPIIAILKVAILKQLLFKCQIIIYQAMSFLDYIKIMMFKPKQISTYFNESKVMYMYIHYLLM